MRKLFNSSFRVFVLMLSLSAAIFLTSCSKDDDKDPVGPGDGNNNTQNKITLNGGGYDNRTFTMTSAVGGFSAEDGVSGVILQGLSGQDSIYVVVAFPGSAAGTFTWQVGDEEESTSGVLINVGTTDYLTSGAATGSTVVTSFGQLGQAITGTFSGTVISAVSTQNVTISGSFSATRLQ